jgi:hypothetical protein
MPTIVDAQNTKGEKFRQCFFCRNGDEFAVPAILSEAKDPLFRREQNCRSLASLGMTLTMDSRFFASLRMTTRRM